MSFHILAKFIVVYAEMLQLLGDFFPQTPNWGSAPGPRWGTLSPRPSDWALAAFPQVPPQTPPMGRIMEEERRKEEKGI